MRGRGGGLALICHFARKLHMWFRSQPFPLTLFRWAFPPKSECRRKYSPKVAATWATRFAPLDLTEEERGRRGERRGGGGGGGGGRGGGMGARERRIRKRASKARRLTVELSGAHADV